jgi:hypothetical protein
MTNEKVKIHALCAEQLPELRGMFERILCVARSSDGPTVGNIQLADRLIDAVVSWSENFLAQPEPQAGLASDGGYEAGSMWRHGTRPAPEPEGPTDEELEDFALQNGGGYFNCDCQEEADILTRKHVSNYRAVLARYARPTIEPVPVSERPWEREGWCDGEDTCWAIGQRYNWIRVYVPGRDWNNPVYTHLLPHRALPAPTH